VSIGERLKKLRLNMKKTLAEAGEFFNVSLNSVYRWEHDLCIPRHSALKKMATFYGVSYEWLLTGSEKEVPAASDGGAPAPQRSIEQKILKMVNKLSETSKYNVIGYIERMYMEEKNDDE